MIATLTNGWNRLDTGAALGALRAGIGVPNTTAHRATIAGGFLLPAYPLWRAAWSSRKTGRSVVRYANFAQSVSNLIGVRRDGSQRHNGAKPMNTPSTGADRAIITPCGKYFDLGGGCHVTLAEFERMTELVGPAFLEDPPDEAAQAEFDAICETGISRAKASTNAAS